MDFVFIATRATFGCLCLYDNKDKIFYLKILKECPRARGLNTRPKVKLFKMLAKLFKMLAKTIQNARLSSSILIHLKIMNSNLNYLIHILF